MKDNRRDKQFNEHAENAEEVSLKKDDACLKQDIKDANSCMLIGAGVGAAGIASALSIGAVCPLCIVAAPSLIGAGFLRRLYLRYRSSRLKS